MKGIINIVWLGVVAGVLVITNPGWTEWSKNLQRPEDTKVSRPLVTDRQGFEAGLSVKPPAFEVFRIQTKGLASIQNDEDVANWVKADDGRMLSLSALKQMPTVGALILFDYNSDVIKADSKVLLRDLGMSLQDTLREAVLVLAGHTDSQGSEAYNQELSRRRARAVKQFFWSEFQVTQERLLVVGFGEQEPIASNESPEGRAQNRRVEFIRIK